MRPAPMRPGCRATDARARQAHTGALGRAPGPEGGQDSVPEVGSEAQPCGSVCCRMRRRWKKRPTRSSLCRRPRKWPKSAPCRPPTSLLPRKALESGRVVAVGALALAGARWDRPSPPPRAAVAGMAASPAGAREQRFARQHLRPPPVRAALWRGGTRPHVAVGARRRLCPPCPPPPGRGGALGERSWVPSGLCTTFQSTCFVSQTIAGSVSAAPRLSAQD